MKRKRLKIFICCKLQSRDENRKFVASDRRNNIYRSRTTTAGRFRSICKLTFFL